MDRLEIAEAVPVGGGGLIAGVAALGFLLVFKGTLDIGESVTTRAINDVWWLGLIAGVLEIFLGFWPSQQFQPAQGSLLLLLVSFYALFRGLSEVALAFQVRAAS